MVNADLSPHSLVIVLANGRVSDFLKAHPIPQDGRYVLLDKDEWREGMPFGPEADLSKHFVVLGWGDYALDAVNGIGLPKFAAPRAVIWNGNFIFAPRSTMPTLYVTDERASWFRRWLHQWAAKRAGAFAQYQHVSQRQHAPLAIYDWAKQNVPSAVLPDARRRARVGVLTRRMIAGGAALALLTQPVVASVTHLQAQKTDQVAAASAKLAEKADAVSEFNFDDGITLDAQTIKGDGLVPQRNARIKTQLGQNDTGKEKASQQVTEGHPTNRDVPPSIAITRPQTPKGGQVIRTDQIRGDGNQRIQATGSKRLTDANGLEFFINTHITFNTSSSASGAASEASFVGPVQATTLNGGFVASTLNDAFDGYNAVCVDIGDTRGAVQCNDTSTYNKNAAPTMDAACGNRQVLYPVKNMGGVEVSRKVFVPSNDSFIRWATILKNPTAAPITLRLSPSNNLGSDSNTKIFSSSSGDTTVTTADLWYGSFQDYSGVTSSDVRMGHIMQGAGASVPVANINAVNGDDNPFWSYLITLQPGETKIILNYATGQATKALVNSKAADIMTQIASGAGSNALACLSSAELSQVANFVATPLQTPPQTSSSPDFAAQQVSTAQIQLTAPAIATSVKVVPTGASVANNKTYEIVLLAQNTSPAAAPAVLASLNVPEGLSVGSIKWEKEGQFYPDGSLPRTCSFDGRTAYCGIGTLWSGMKATITLKVTAPPGAYRLGVNVEDLSPLYEVPTENQKTITLNLD